MGLGKVFLAHSSTNSDILALVGETSLIKTRLQDIAIFMFKINKTLLPTNTSQLFRRSQVDYYIPRARTVTYGKH